MFALKEVARADPVHCCLFSLLGLGFFVSMCGLAAIPVGDIRFELSPVTEMAINATYPTASSSYTGDRITVEFKEGVAVREYVTLKNHSVVGRGLTREWGSYIPGLKLTFGSSYYYQSTQEWKVVPEEMPLMWVAPMWAFLTGALTLAASYLRRRDMLLNALLLVGVSASLLLLASHRVVELTQFCGECDAMTKHIADDGKTLGGLPDGAVDPDMFADNNCPEILHLKCEKGRDVYVAGSVICLICMYIMLGTIEARRHGIFSNPSLSSQDEAGKTWSS